MTAAVEELYSLLVPLAEGRLVVPRACIAEVAGYNQPEPVNGAPHWLLGRMEWNGRTIPLISFEGACGEAMPRTGPRSRVVVFRAISDKLRTGYFGLVTQGFPQLVRVNPAVLAPDTGSDWPADSPVLCQVRMVNQRPLIPDLELLETMIAVELDKAA
ncbi:MAG: chemotaxis protein CheW [Gammaproteobacteria bacterium]|nr:chemotaxis protein CheW [Gammaproteobacteria bacterium]NNF61031.1 chemotaxis protein CheW [Gammaproteobacteria bacterium]NNM21881.1 chemotaxis protein CheW [Gammaproteobacteria bacterium]